MTVSVASVLTSRTHYEVLGLKKGGGAKQHAGRRREHAVPRAVRSAYKQASLAVHPDKSSVDGAEEAFKAISAAIRLAEQRACAGAPPVPVRSASCAT